MCVLVCLACLKEIERNTYTFGNDDTPTTALFLTISGNILIEP